MKMEQAQITQTATMLASLLRTLGFESLASDCASEDSPTTLRHYARIVVKNMDHSKHPMAAQVAHNLKALNLV